MHTNNIALFSLALMLLLQCLGCAGREPAESVPPNIIVIMADDLGWKDLHCYGTEQLDTPALDRLAAYGMRFTDAYAASPVCSPTRAAMMTGQAPARIALTNHAPGHRPGFVPEDKTVGEAESVHHLALSYETIAERLKQAGYATAHVGKWHLSHVGGGEKFAQVRKQHYPEHQGFDVNIGGNSSGGPRSYFAPYQNDMLPDGEDGEYLPQRLADEAIAFIEQNRGEPFYLNYWPYSVHYPMQALPKLINKYEARQGPGLPNPTYAAMIEGMDAELGRLFDALDEAGLADNTLVIFKSDNGGEAGDNSPLRGVKGYLYEGGIRVPLIARWPGKIKPDTTSDTPVISMDIYATVLDAAGLSPKTDEPIDGESLMPLLTNTGTLDREAIYFHYPNYAYHKRNRLGSAVRAGDHKLIKRYDDGSLELYDLSADIGEQQNLAEQKPELAKSLEAKLNAWLNETGANLPVQVEDTWTPLFNGKDLNGWHAKPGGEWKVIDGVIVGTSDKSEERHGLLISDKTYTDFEIRLKFKAIKGNSGFYFRSEEIAHPFGVRGFQAEIELTNATGGLYETRGRGWVKKPDAEIMKSIYTPGDWTDLTIRAVNGDLTIYINGHKTVELTDDPGATQGHFALQLHGGQDMEVQFKDIAIREIK